MKDIQKLNIVVQPKSPARSIDFNATTAKVDEIIDALNSGDASFDVDSELSLESTNPVENKVVTAEFEKKIESRKITDLDEISRLTIEKLTSVIPVIFPSSDEWVEVRIAIGGNIYSLGKIYQATLQSAGLLSPAQLKKLNGIDSLSSKLNEVEQKATNSKLEAIEYTDRKIEEYVVDIVVDEQVDEYSKNPVENRAIYLELKRRITARDFTDSKELLELRKEYLSKVTYDAVLSFASTNAPQTKIVKAAIEQSIESAHNYTDSKTYNLKEYVNEGLNSAKEYTDISIAEAMRDGGTGGGDNSELSERVTTIESSLLGINEKNNAQDREISSLVANRGSATPIVYFRGFTPKNPNTDILGADVFYIDSEDCFCRNVNSTLAKSWDESNLWNDPSTGEPYKNKVYVCLEDMKAYYFTDFGIECFTE